MRLLCGLLLLATIAGADEGVWDPSGEFMISRPKPQETVPETVETLLKGIVSAQLKPQVAKVRAAAGALRGGDYKGALELARAGVDAVRQIRVTEADLKPRAVVLGLYLLVRGEAEGLLGNLRAGLATLREAEALTVPPALQAEAAQTAGWLALGQGDISGALAAEQRARRLDPTTVPVLEAAALVWRGLPQQGLADLKARLSGDKVSGRLLLLAAVAALAIEGHEAEAAGYYNRPAVRTECGYLPLYDQVGGLLEAEAGRWAAAAQIFSAGAAKEFGASRPVGLMVGVAQLAAGQAALARTTLGQTTGYAPAGLQALGLELLRQPSPAVAQQALRTGSLWFSELPYRPGSLPVAPAQGEPTASAPASAEGLPPLPPEADATAPALPELGPPTGGAAPVEAPAEGPPPAGYDVRSASSSAAAAYGSALRLLAAGQLREAEAALTGALRLAELPEAWQALGQVKLLLGQPEAARAALLRALRSRPNSAACRYLMAQAHDLLGQLEVARAWYRAALEVGLTEPLAAYARGRLMAPAD